MKLGGFFGFCVAAAIFCAATVHGAEKAIKVGIFGPVGAQGIMECLGNTAGFKPEIINALDADTIFKYDVIILSSVKGGLPNRECEDALAMFVQCGGGVMLTHDATGFRGWRRPLFPELFKGSGKSRNNEIAVTETKHPATGGLPRRFTHAYQDHITLTPGGSGKVLLKDGDGVPAVIAGELGDGKVIGCGMIIGYAYLKIGGNMEKVPEGGEKDFLLNAVKWLGTPALTGLPEDVLAARKNKVRNEIALKRAAQVVDKDGASAVAGLKNESAGWYSDIMFNEQGFVHPPVQLLPGKFFLFDGPSVGIAMRGNLREYKEAVAICKQLKWLGVTDIIAVSGGPLKVRYPSKVKDTFNIFTQKDARDFDYLDFVTRACHEAGLDVWVFWHPKIGKSKNPQIEAYMIKNTKGQIYSPHLDILNPRTLELSKEVINELAQRYNKYGNLKGIFLDELWHSFVGDYLEDNVEEFVQYCRKNYNEAPPSDIAKNFAKGPEWHDPADKWWRRYILWRNTHIVNYTRAVTAHANSKGLSVMTQPAFPLMWDTAWFWGVGNTHELVRAGDLMWSYEGRNNSIYEPYPKNKVILATHTNAPCGYSCAAMVSGHYGSLFVLQSNWMPIALGASPRAMEFFEKIVRTNLEWYGGDSLKELAVLTNSVALQLRFKNPSVIFKENDQNVQRNFNAMLPTGMIMVEDIEFYENYKVLIAAKHSLEYISEAQYAALQKYLRNGGILLVLNGRVSTSNPDLTGMRDHTFELLGIEKADNSIKAGNKILSGANVKKSYEFKSGFIKAGEIANKAPALSIFASAENGKIPLVTVMPHGSGKVISLNFDVMALFEDRVNQGAADDFMKDLIAANYVAPIRAEGGLQIFSALKKGNWVVVSLLCRNHDFWKAGEEYPAQGKLFVDMAKLGVKRDKYKVVSMARDREMMPQGKYWSLWGKTYWTESILKNDGIDVFIPKDSKMNLELPSKCKDEYTVKWIIPRWNETDRSRSYEYEIIAIAPVDEASMMDSYVPAKNAK